MQLTPVGSPGQAPTSPSTFQGFSNTCPHHSVGFPPFDWFRVAPLWPEYHNTPLPLSNQVMIYPTVGTLPHLTISHQLNLIA